MAFEPGQRGQFASQINVTPLVDVMLVLLVIFMVTAPMIQQGVEVNVPRVKSSALPGKEEQFVVSITRNQEVYLNDTRLGLEQLTEKLQAIAIARPDREVFVRAEHAVRNPVMPVERIELLLNTVAIAILLRKKPPERGRLQGHGVINAVRLHGELGRRAALLKSQLLNAYLVRIGKVRKLLPPVVPLLMQQFSKLQQISIPGAIV